MKCYICLSDSVLSRPDYFDLLRVTLISARRNTTLRLVCLYDGEADDEICTLLEEYGVEIILHQLPYKQELMEIYPKEWMQKNLHKVIEYSRIFGTFMRMEIPAVEKQEQYVFYSDIDVLFTGDIRLEELPRPACLAAAPESDIDVSRMTYFNAGILLLNIEGMKEKYQTFREMLARRQRNADHLFDQGYLNELCFADRELLPLEYNWKPYWGINPNAKIIHYHGMKPSSELHEAGFITNDRFFLTAFDNNKEGFAGYVYYFVEFFRYLGKEEDLWLYHHLQYIYNLYSTNSSYERYKRKYKKYKRLCYSSLVASAVVVALALITVILSLR